MKLTRMMPVHASPVSNGVRRLVAALSAVVCALASLALVVQVASADSTTTNCVSGIAGLCVPDDIVLGDDVSDPTNDTGVATYVGRDMYIGAARGSGEQNFDYTPNNYDEAGPQRSYAVEAEGLTIVNGKLAIHPVKESWRTNDGYGGWLPAGFRFGAVGHGFQFRPQSSGAILAVGGNDSNIATMIGDGATSVGAWELGAWVNRSKEADGNTLVSLGKDSSGNEINYTAQIAGNSTKINAYGSYYNSRESVVDNAGNWSGPTGTSSFWNSTSALSVRGNDYSGGASAAKIVNGQTIVALSEKLSRLAATGGDSTSSQSINGYTRYKYNFNTPMTEHDQYKYVVDNASETVISFTGDGASPLQVFSLDSSRLPSSGNVSFSFKNIPDDASVVINVTGKTVSFHHGWRFIWNGTDISNYFVTAGNAANNSGTTAENNKLYASVASRLLWNFADASSVTIKGSEGEGAIYDGSDSCANGCPTPVSDEPSSAFMGTILAPNGSLESHVSTNGRVWVGQDFSMFNPTPTAYFASSGESASVVDMDQERHNLPWKAVYSPSGSGITWNKTGVKGNALGGTTWGIYASEENAKNKTSALKTVTDNDAFDDSSADGTFTVNGLNPEAKYYIREISVGSNTAYALNTNIYSITSGSSGSVGSGITWVSGDSSDHQLVDGSNQAVDSSGVAITNAKTSVSWSKVDAASTGTLLEGSEWTVSTGSGDSARSWTVADNDGSSSYSCAASDPVNGSSAGVLCDTDATAGKFTVEGLSYDSSSGTTYTLKETKAPDGYVKSDATYSFTIAADGSVGAVSSTDSSQTVTGNTITNAKAITALAKTGAAGIAPFSVIGLALVAAAAMFGIRARKSSHLA